MRQVLTLWVYMMSLGLIVLAALFAPQIVQKPEDFELNVILAALANLAAFTYAFCRRKSNDQRI